MPNSTNAVIYMPGEMTVQYFTMARSAIWVIKHKFQGHQLQTVIISKGLLVNTSGELPSTNGHEYYVFCFTDRYLWVITRLMKFHRTLPPTFAAKYFCIFLIPNFNSKSFYYTFSLSLWNHCIFPEYSFKHFKATEYFEAIEYSLNSHIFFCISGHLALYLLVLKARKSETCNTEIITNTSSLWFLMRLGFFVNRFLVYLHVPQKDAKCALCKTILNYLFPSLGFMIWYVLTCSLHHC